MIITMNKVVNVTVIIVVMNFGPPQTLYFMIEIAARYLKIISYF